MSEENNIQNLEEKRRQKAKSFTLNIQDDIYDESAKTENNEPEELNSYSGEDVKEQMAKNSKQATKNFQKPKISVTAEFSELSGWFPL